MGILNHGIFGPQKGRTGNVIGSFWKKINILRIRPESYHDANNHQQQDQRMRFNLINDFASLNKTLIKIGFSIESNSSSAFNRATKYNMIHAITGTYPDLKLDINLARISTGDLEGLELPIVSSPQAKTIRIEWHDNSGHGYAKATDNVFITIIDETIEDAFINDTMIKRSYRVATIELPQKWSGRNVAVMAFTASEMVINTAKSKCQISNSAVLGKIRVA